MRLKYNAPTVLTFTLLCTGILILAQTLIPGFMLWFAVPGKDTFFIGSFQNWVTLITHVMGHANWAHLFSNLMLILIIGPMLEEIYGSVNLLIMMLVTALVTGFLNVIFIPAYLLGASGIVFMMILLSSFTNFSRGEVPLTFILVLILYIGSQIIESFNPSNISHFAHIIGGLCGSFFGFLRPARQRVP